MSVSLELKALTGKCKLQLAQLGVSEDFKGQLGGSSLVCSSIKINKEEEEEQEINSGTQSTTPS